MDERKNPKRLETLEEYLLRRLGPKPEGDECWIWRWNKSNYGYGAFQHNGKSWNAHRAAWVAFKGEIPNGLYVLHRCDVTACCNPDHLFLGTQKENMRDMTNKGRRVALRGSASPIAVLNEEKVMEILRSPLGCGTIAKIMGVHEQTIVSIRNGRNWAHVLPEISRAPRRRPRKVST